MYGNFKVLSKTGELLFRTENKKIEWYLTKGLAKKIDESTIQLIFDHKGRNAADDEFALSEKENICVVCGTAEDLTRHHVVPYWYRKYFPLKYKEHSSHDVLLACRECHTWYETVFANRLKAEIASEYDVPFLSTEFRDKLRIQAAAKAIINHGEAMPQTRLDDLILRLAIELGDFPSDEHLKELATTEYFKEARFCHGQKVIEKVTNYQEFAERWRNHFVQTMRPRFLPKGWDVKRSLEIDASKGIKI